MEESNARSSWAVKICCEFGWLIAAEADEMLEAEGEGGGKDAMDKDRRCALEVYESMDEVYMVEGAVA